ncbi:hypothetical protein KIW84_070492 [Lathyrus oleraceus]|uniref:Bulb-type lectin domain-containing protein n=1 Tax=Pisum sativum TaxID=3888 RepID=A0A9D4VHN5_PEA|nr:hypothetical protein KIW84_070490 [Pisum sativum]KAI5383106.1 hypothetical protein KIW84_070492 [Pisum sativum]
MTALDICGVRVDLVTPDEVMAGYGWSTEQLPEIPRNKTAILWASYVLPLFKNINTATYQNYMNNRISALSSFDNPSDTLLPGQRLSVSKYLRASSKDLETSYYSLYLNASGRSQLRWESNIVYWTSESHSSTANLTASITSDGSFQLQDQHSKAV